MWAARICVGAIVASSILFAQRRAAIPHAKTASEVQVPGDAAQGKAIFDGKGGCLECHMVGSQGSIVGVNLSAVATQLTVAQLQNALLNPSPTVNPGNQLYRVVMSDGKVITGKLLNQDLSSLQMLDSQGNLVAVQRSNVKEAGFTQTPPMPSYRDKLTPEEQTNLIAYLATLKGIISQ